MADSETLGCLSQQFDRIIQANIIPYLGNTLADCGFAIQAIRDGKLTPEQESEAISLIKRILSIRQGFIDYFQREAAVVAANDCKQMDAAGDALISIINASHKNCHDNES